ncbi:unnamed protein product [Clonostachys rosea]|uniref:F-box domain-containing protein n=1 Tax=Bionectria ochroleuca TaxID=29856 RepID=A0ABY6TNC7_BIOOC|nr:unnamed protein product [Clonostachys rosea]
MGPTAFSLLDLSPEILVQILEELCLHCSGVVDSTDTQSLGRCDLQVAKASQGALAALSRSCRVLRNVAQPYLYHYIAPGEKPRLLARTLMQRPALAQLVEELAITALDCDRYNQLFLEENQEMLEMQVRTDDFDKDAYRQDRVMGMFMLKYTPKLRKLFVLTDSLMPVMRYPHGTLSCLTNLRAKCDDIGSGFCLSVLAGIMEAAPNLKTLTVNNITQVDLEEREIFSQSVTEVNIAEAAISSEEFEMIIRGFPNLQVLRFETGGDRAYDIWCATPADMAKILLIRKATLREINFSINARFFPDELLERADVIDDLSGMTSLETIVLSSESIYSESDDNTYTDGSYLIDLLPESVKVLGLVDPSYHLEDDIFRLAARAYRRFPLLKKVMLQDVGRSTRKAYKQAFKNVGIECVKAKGLDVIVRN